MEKRTYKYASNKKKLKYVAMHAQRQPDGMILFHLNPVRWFIYDAENEQVPTSQFTICNRATFVLPGPFLADLNCERQGSG